MRLDPVGWREFRFGDLIDSMYKAQTHTKDDFEIATVHDFQVMPYVTRTEENNGVDDFIVNSGRLTGVEEGNALVIGDTTAIVSYQLKPFVCGDHIVIIRAKWLNLYTGLFIATLLKREHYRYSYGRAYTMNLISDTIIKLPTKDDRVPDWVAIEKFMGGLHTNPITTSNMPSRIPLEIGKWKKFRVGDLFLVKKGKRLTAEDQLPGNTVYVGAIDSNNGVASHIGQWPIHEGNTISLSYNGSVGEAFYQPDSYWATDDVNALYFRRENKHAFNVYIGLFIATLLKAEKYRFSYGRKWVLKDMEDTILKLPVTKEGTPDWNFMERYIRSLPYGDRIPQH